MSFSLFMPVGFADILRQWLFYNQYFENIIGTQNKFPGLNYKCRYLYLRKYLLVYHPFLKDIMEYGILIYGSAAKEV